MEKLIVLGTGNGNVVECYNTCFILQNPMNQYLLVDTGGGNGILKQIKDAKIELSNIHDIIISHNHMDHLLGLFWIMRVIAKEMSSNKYIGNLNIYCHKDITSLVVPVLDKMFPPVFMHFYKERMNFIDIDNHKKIDIIGYNIKFLDLYSKEGQQYGFKLKLENNKELAFLGDVPCSEKIHSEIENIDWLLHESFCLYSEANKYKPYEKGHITAKEASQIANQLNAKNLVLWHLQDNDLINRKKLYTNECKQYFNGNIYVPDDLDIINL